MPYPSKKIAITAEAKATEEEIKAAGGLRSLTINNHLIQDQTTAQAIADTYLAEYKKQKIKMRITITAPLPYEIGDTIWKSSEKTPYIGPEAEVPYKPAAEAEIPYKPAAEAKVPYRPVVSVGRLLIIRKINIRFSAGNFISTMELEG